MQLHTLGLNHRTAPVAVREKVSFSPPQQLQALQQLKQYGLTEEAVIVSTCNRTELYCVQTMDKIPLLIEWLGDYHAIKPVLLQQHLYDHTNQQAIRHLLRVACGLDSMVLGEPQILGQIKSAYQTARQAGAAGRLLNRLFEHSFSVAKQVRTDTAIGSSPVSIAFAAVRLAQQIFGDLESATALLIGAGETIELAARHLHEKGLGRIIVANRTLERARQLSKEFAGYAITLEEIPQHLAEADIVISSTASLNPVLTRQQVQQALKIRRQQPIFMVDIAVPRDIEPAVGNLEDVYLYSVDDLHEVIQENLRSRQQAALQAEEIIDTQVSHYITWLRSLDTVDTIRLLRKQSQVRSETVLKKARKMLDNGRDPQQVLDFLASTLTNALLHTPCEQLRQAGQEQENLLFAARQLFQVHPEEAEKQ